MDVTFSWNFPELRQAFEDERQYVTIRAGRGSGKTYGAFLWILQELLMGKGGGLWVDTLQGNLDTYIDQYVRDGILKNIWKVMKYNREKHRLFFPNGSFLQLVSGERPENAEGFRYERTILNEAGLILKNDYLWNNSIEPMTHPVGRENKTRLVGTPKGKNLFWELCMLDDEDWGHYHFTAEQSPNSSGLDLDKLRSRVPTQVFKQEYMAEFVEDGGEVFRSVRDCIGDGNDTNDVMSIDLGKHHDFTVVMVGDSNGVVNYIDRFNKLDWGFQKQRIEDIWLRFGRPRIIIDSTGVGDSVYDDLAKIGASIIPFKFSLGSKTQIIQNLSVAIDNREITFPANDTLISELESFAYEVSPSGNIRYNAPSGKFDDMVIALALFNHMRQRQPKIATVPSRSGLGV